MESKFTIFYSWQSDLPSNKNKNAINNCIEKAIKKTQREIVADRDTKNVAGTPDITNTIFEKIDESDYFVADISLVSKYGKAFKNKKYNPNSNVLLELGYAAGVLGWDRILCVFNTEFGNMNDLPFDLRNKRILSYNSKEQNYRKELTAQFKDIFEEASNKGIRAKSGLSLIKIMGYNFEKHDCTNNLIPYKLSNTPNYKTLKENLKDEIKELCNNIGKCVVQPRHSIIKKTMTGSAVGRLVAYNWNKSEYVDAEPFDLDRVIDRLGKIVNLNYERSYFSFGNLKISTTPVLSIPGLNNGPSLEGTEDEKNKRYLYIDLVKKIDDYELMEEFVEIMDEYDIFPLIIFNNSLIKDENIEIDLSVDEQTKIIKLKDIVDKFNEKKLINLVGDGLLTKLLFNFVYSDEITNEDVPTKYPRVDMFNREKEEDLESSTDEYEKLVLNFDIGVEKLEGRIYLDQLRAHERKWASKLIIVNKNSNLIVDYKIKSDFSDGDIKQQATINLN